MKKERSLYCLPKHSKASLLNNCLFLPISPKMRPIWPLTRLCWCVNVSSLKSSHVISEHCEVLVTSVNGHEAHFRAVLVFGVAGSDPHEQVLRTMSSRCSRPWRDSCILLQGEPVGGLSVAQVSPSNPACVWERQYSSDIWMAQSETSEVQWVWTWDCVVCHPGRWEVTRLPLGYRQTSGPARIFTPKAGDLRGLSWICCVIVRKRFHALSLLGPI